MKSFVASTKRQLRSPNFGSPELCYDVDLSKLLMQSSVRSESDHKSETSKKCLSMSGRKAIRNATSGDKKPRNSLCVRFGSAHLIEFEPTIHCGGVASDGVPIGMSNKVRCQARYSIDLWEYQRVWSRVTRENFMENGYLEPEERISILFEAGFSEKEIDQKMEEANRYNEHRWESNEYDMRYHRYSCPTPDSEDGSYSKSKSELNVNHTEVIHSRDKTQENDVFQYGDPADFQCTLENMRLYDRERIVDEEDCFHFNRRDLMEMFDTTLFEPGCIKLDTKDRITTQTCTMACPMSLQNHTSVDAAIVVAV
ncbi:unnamed protein product [Albugo candida]|uniref:Uncharacterized protein n=1 Tax=Albugo candida TaxID=65357 RepID=A0A024G7Y7_9STRA|nr:unnamed protein product [Albugo candida]|eukprot:CCI42406.1 unnamed protein product [Albugo candida]